MATFRDLNQEIDRFQHAYNDLSRMLMQVETRLMGPAALHALRPGASVEDADLQLVVRARERLGAASIDLATILTANRDLQA
jgi:hypothetical protein